MDDAEFVQVIHTNTKKLGHVAPMGHIDYYLNGGDQGAVKEILSSCKKLTTLANSCSHHYAYWFLAKMYNFNLKCEGEYEVGDLLGQPGDYERVELTTSKAVENEDAKVIQYENIQKC